MNRPVSTNSDSQIFRLGVSQPFHKIVNKKPNASQFRTLNTMQHSWAAGPHGQSPSDEITSEMVSKLELKKCKQVLMSGIDAFC